MTNAFAKQLAAALDYVVINNGAVAIHDAIQLTEPLFNEGHLVDFAEQLEVAIKLSSLAQCNDGLIFHRQLSNPTALYQHTERAKCHHVLRADIYQQIRAGQLPQFSIHHQRLYDYLCSDLGLDPLQRFYKVHTLFIQFNTSNELTRIIDQLGISFTDAEQAKAFDILLSLVYQHTPQWLAGGLTPHQQYVPSEDTKPQLPTDGVKLIRKTKIGRNAPCECGSGKKYKKCCGAV